MNSTVKTLLILGVVIGGGAAAYYYWQKNKKTAAPLVAVTNNNPNAHANAGLAANINSGITAAQGLVNLGQSLGVGQGGV